MKKRLLAGLLALGAMASSASEFEPYFYQFSSLNTSIPGWSGSGLVYLNGHYRNGSYKSEGFRIINNSIALDQQTLLANADDVIKKRLWPYGKDYIEGFFSNYPDLPSDILVLKQFDLPENISSEEYLDFANSLLKLVKADLMGDNLVYQTDKYFSVLEVRGNIVVITDGYAGTSGNTIYSCDISDFSFSSDIETNLTSCYSAPYRYASNSTYNGIPGLHAPITDRGLLFSRVRPNEGEFEVRKLKIIDPESGIKETGDLGIVIGPYSKDLTVSSDNGNYIYLNSDEGDFSSVFQYQNGNLEKLNSEDLVEISGLEKLYPLPIYGSAGGDAVFFKKRDGLDVYEIYSCKLSTFNMENLLYEDFVQRYSPELGIKSLLVEYPDKPSNYEELVTDLELQSIFPQGITDSEFKIIVDELLVPKYEEITDSSDRIIGCQSQTKNLITTRGTPLDISSTNEKNIFVYSEAIHDLSDPSSLKVPNVVVIDLDSGNKKYASTEILKAVGLDDLLIKISVDSVISGYPWLNIDKIEKPADLAALGLSEDLDLEEFKSYIHGLILGHSPFKGKDAVGYLSAFQAPVFVGYSDGVLHTNIGSIRLSSASSPGVKVSVKPENNTIDPYLNAVFSVEIITDGELFAADVNCAVDGPMAVTSADYGSWGGTERLTLPLQWDNKNTHGVVSLKGDVAPVTDEQQLLVLDTLAEMTTADVTVNCQATVSDQAGNPLSVTVVPATIRIDDGIHGGSGVITGQVDLPAGVTPQDVTVQVTINGRTIDVTVDENGSFQFDGLRDGEFVVNVVSDRYTQSCINTQTTGSVNDLGVIELIAGDINSDGEINIADFTFLAGRYGSLKGDDNYSALADLNSDEQINVQDLAILGNHFGSRQCSL